MKGKNHERRNCHLESSTKEKVGDMEDKVDELTQTADKKEYAIVTWHISD